MKQLFYLNKKKLLCCLLVNMLLIFILSGCAPTHSACTVALGYYDLITKHDAASLIKLGMPQSTADSIIANMNTSICAQVKEQLSMNGQVDIDDHLVAQIVDAYLASLHKLSATCSETKSGEGYTVTLSTTYIDYPAIDKKAVDQALDEIDNSTYSDETEYLSKLTTAYIKYLLQGYQNASASTDQISSQFVFTKQQGLYLPKDYEAFTAATFLMVTHQQ